FAPVKIRHGIFCRPAFLKRDDGGAVGCALERLEIAQVVHLENLEVFLVAELKAAETVTRTCSLEQRLCDDEAESSAVFHIIVETGVSKQHRQIFLAAAEPR